MELMDGSAVELLTVVANMQGAAGGRDTRQGTVLRVMDGQEK